MEKMMFCLTGGDCSPSAGEALASSLQTSQQRTVGRRSKDAPHQMLVRKGRGKANPASEHRGCLTSGAYGRQK